VNQMAIDVENAGAILLLANDVALPNFVE
jgi:hypothetical protein